MPGPPPKFTPEERALQGNPGNRAPAPGNALVTTPIAPDTLTDVPEPPEWLDAGNGGDIGAMAVQAWRTIAPLLVASRTLREGDQMPLARYCRYVAEWVHLTADLDDRGMIIATVKGLVRNPAAMIRNGVETSIVALERELGLSPKARTEVQKRIMESLKDIPIVGGNKKEGSAVGFLNRKKHQPDEGE